MLPPNFQIRHLKVDRFLFLIVPQKARRNAPRSQSIGKTFKKGNILFQFCIESVSHLENRGAPTIWLKTAPK